MRRVLLANEVRVCCSAIPQVFTNLRFHSRAARWPERGSTARATGLQNDALVSCRPRGRYLFRLGTHARRHGRRPEALAGRRKIGCLRTSLGPSVPRTPRGQESWAARRSVPCDPRKEAGAASRRSSSSGSPAAPSGAHQEISNGQLGWLVQLTKCACAAARSFRISQTYASTAAPPGGRSVGQGPARLACSTTRLLYGETLSASTGTGAKCLGRLTETGAPAPVGTSAAL